MRNILGILLLFSLSCGSGATPISTLVPPILRPNTTDIVRVSLSHGLLDTVKKIFIEAMPNEGAVCFYGKRLDNALVVTRVVPMSVVVSSPDGMKVDPCTYSLDLVGAGHSHLKSEYAECWPSPSDSYFLFENRNILFLGTFCMTDGFGTVQLQDGRIYPFVWGYSN
jgi:hypothetical protein